MERAQAVCGKKGHSCEYVQVEKHRTLRMKYEISERLALALNEDKPEEPQLFDGTKALPKSPKDIGRLNLSYLQ